MIPFQAKNSFPRDLVTSTEGVYERFLKAPFHMMPLQKTPTVQDVRQAVQKGPVIVCDLYIQDIEKEGTPIVSKDGTLLGYRKGEIINIDHHGPEEEKLGLLSTGPQSGIFLRDLGDTLAPNIPVATHHTDCDSILSCLQMLRVLQPHPILDRAALSADHTCLPDPIADVLQEMTELKQEPGYEKEAWRLKRFSLGVLLFEQIVTGRGVEGRELLEKLQHIRQEKRALANQIFARRDFESFDNGALILVQQGIDSEFLPAVFRDAAIILSVSPRTDNSGKHNIRIRLGANALNRGITRAKLNLEAFDPAAGGRMDAGSNERGGGTHLAPLEYAERVLECWKRELRRSLLL